MTWATETVAVGSYAQVTTLGFDAVGTVKQHTSTGCVVVVPCWTNGEDVTVNVEWDVVMRASYREFDTHSYRRSLRPVAQRVAVAA